ncbi:MAG: hypothetical protein JWM95_2900 [Gemmatimonadetes bacterium]|nr:hypothetical protein [Gemmatimonadota bacterium]
MTHAFLYASGLMSDLGTLGGTNSRGYGINSAGQTTGYSSVAGNAESHAFLYSGGVMSDLGDLGGSYSEGFAINSSGEVAGYSYLAGDAIFHAFLYSGGVMTDLNGLLPSGSGWDLEIAYGINDSGQITGAGVIDGEIHAFVLTPTTVAPEPGDSVLVATGLLGLLVIGRRRHVLNTGSLSRGLEALH